MRTLIVVRHAQAESAHLHPRDFDRPLTWQGADDARSAAAQLKKDYPEVAAIVASPARRTQTTAEIIAQAYGLESDAVELDPRLYEADVATLEAVVAELGQRDGVVVLVGHNPGVLELCYRRTNGRVTTMPTCAVVHIDVERD